ncbi:hypothetical protein IMCC1989_1732 [gamma proteobacterium IMCC1989]|nr:hypothetical protein IMCC1989_1732 [gamma proteobacterium IMCC1989]
MLLFFHENYKLSQYLYSRCRKLPKNRWHYTTSKNTAHHCPIKLRDH